MPAMMHAVAILADAEEILKVMGVVGLGGLFGLACLLGALLHFLSRDVKTAWVFLGVGVVCFVPALCLFVLPEIAHLFHRH